MSGAARRADQVLELAVRHEVATQLKRIDEKSLDAIANQVAEILKKSADAGRSATKDVTTQATQDGQCVSTRRQARPGRQHASRQGPPRASARKPAGPPRASPSRRPGRPRASRPRPARRRRVPAPAATKVTPERRGARQGKGAAKGRDGQDDQGGRAQDDVEEARPKTPAKRGPPPRRRTRRPPAEQRARRRLDNELVRQGVDAHSRQGGPGGHRRRRYPRSPVSWPKRRRASSLRTGRSSCSRRAGAVRRPRWPGSSMQRSPASTSPVGGRRTLDAGASTGGFTDCLLQAQAPPGSMRLTSATASSVGAARRPGRVTVLERTNVPGR